MTSEEEQAAVTERLREAIRRAPHKMTLQLAREHGVPEVEVVRAFPEDRATELDTLRWEPLLRGLEACGPVWVLVSNGAATVEVAGEFGGFSTAGDYFNVQTATLDMHIRWRELAAVFAVEKPGHLKGPTTYSLQFFDRAGAAAFKVFLNFGEPIPAERLLLFRQIVETFRHTPASTRPGGGEPARQ
jgi:putative hemin transport protein